MGGPWTGPGGLCEGSSALARGLGSGTGTASAFSGKAAPASSETGGSAGSGCMGGPCMGPAGFATSFVAGFVAGAAACGSFLAAGATSGDCGSASWPPIGSLSGFASGTGAMEGVATFFAGRALRCLLGALCCGDENSVSSFFSSQLFAAKESVGETRKTAEIVMAKASRGIDSLPMTVKRPSRRPGCIEGAAGPLTIHCADTPIASNPSSR